VTQTGFSSVRLISSIQTVKGLTGKPRKGSGKPLEKTVILGAGTPTLSLPQRRILFTTKEVFPVVSSPTGLFTNITLLPLMKARFVLFFILVELLTLIGNHLSTRLLCLFIV